MTEVDIAPSFGVELKDGFKTANAWVANGVSWLDDIQQFYRDRSVIEKEYSSKLSALAKKYHEKKAKKSGSLSVGDTPTLTPGSLESASLTTWTTQLSTLERRAAEHERYSAELITQVAEPLRISSLRYDELRKSHAEFAAKLEKEKEAAFVALKRTKGQYDGICQEVESRRKKVETSFDSRSKAQSSFQQQILEMHNVKNTYILSLNVTNKQKEKYYHVDVPELLDSLQDLSEIRVSHLNRLWSHVTRLENDTLSRSVDQMKYLSSEILRNDPRLDSMMFVQHNIPAWQEPPDALFEPSPLWHDDGLMAVDEMAKIFLRNILGKSKSQMVELRREADAKRRDVQKARLVRQNIREGRDKRDEVDVVRAIFIMQGDLHEIERKRMTAEVETSTITSVVGDISLGAQNHNFKSQTFKIPTNCDLCGERIWGLSAKGFDCRDCGYTCHSKCELKVPADCPGEQTKEDRKRLKAERQATANVAPPPTNGSTNVGPPEGVAELPDLSRSNTMNSLSSGYAASAQRSVSGTGGRATAEEANQDKTSTPRPVARKTATLRKNRIVAPPPEQYVSGSLASELPSNGGGSSLSSKAAEARAKILFPYEASGERELSVEEGMEVVIVEPDDGSGWVTVRVGHSSGIVPAAYMEALPQATPSLSERPGSSYSNSSTSAAGSTHAATTAKKKGPAVAPKRGAKKLNYVEALYEYEARSDAEWSMTEGERFVLVSKDSGDGWANVEKGGHVKSVPANYIQEV